MANIPLGQSTRPGVVQQQCERGLTPMSNMIAKADELREALSRVDRNGDGLLNFDEFKSGLRGLGVQLPDKELVKIWHEASSEEGATPAGKPTFQGPLPGGFNVNTLGIPFFPLSYA